jgi:hypothetical protein
MNEWYGKRRNVEITKINGYIKQEKDVLLCIMFCKS